MNFEEIYKQEVELFNSINKRFEKLKDNDITGSYQLAKESLQAFNRWSSIRCDIRKSFGRDGAAVKSRLEDICKYLMEVYTVSRMVWNKATDSYANKEDM